MTYPRILALVALALTAACGSSQTPTVDLAAEGSHLMTLENEWLAALQSGDVDAAMAFVASEPMILVPDAPPIVGRDAFRDVVQTMIDDEFEYSWEPVRAVVSPKGEMAYDYGKSYVRQPDGTVIEGNYMVVWVREHGEWKVAVDMVN